MMYYKDERLRFAMNFMRTYDVRLGGDGTVEGFLARATDESAFYVVNLGSIVEQHNTWRELLPTVRPYYAVKCNPNPAVIDMLHILGVGFDCASKDEIRLVKERGADDIVFANPCKAGGDIQFARAEGVDTLVVDDVNELLKIKLYHPEAKLIVRIMTNDSHSACRFNCKFGAALEDLDDLMVTAASMDLNVVGVSFHVGSQCRDPSVYREAIANARRVFDIAESLGRPMSLLDIGGGFPGGEDPETFRAAAAEINDGLLSFFGDLEDVRVIAEPGRYFVAASHTLVANVIGKKMTVGPDGTRTFRYYLNDGVYGSFNCIVFDHSRPKLVPYAAKKDAALYESKVFGPTCDSIDTISDSCLLPELAIGEWVTVENFGAYTIAAASTFNGFQQTKCLYSIYKT